MPKSLVFSVREILDRNGLKVEEKLPPEPYQAPGAEPEGPLAATLEFSVGGESILMTASVSGAWKLSCARCLRDIRKEFVADFDETFSLEDDDIDAEEEIRQGLSLAAPTRALCRDDCRGLCPRCGRNLNEGPCRCDGGGTTSEKR